MPKVAKNAPASTNSRSPATPCAPMVAIASPPITTRPATMTRGADRAPRRQPFVQHDGREHDAEQRRAVEGWITPPWPSGTSRKSGVADEGDARSAEECQHDAAAPADAVEVGKLVAQDQRQQHHARPEAAMEGEVGRCEPDVDAVARGDESEPPRTSPRRRRTAMPMADRMEMGLMASVPICIRAIRRHAPAMTLRASRQRMRRVRAVAPASAQWGFRNRPWIA